MSTLAYPGISIASTCVFCFKLTSARAADIFADLFELDPVLLTWTDLTDVAAGPFPSGRLGHAFTSFADRIYVHGGVNYIEGV